MTICINDQLRKGAVVALGATHTSICPVAAILDYLNARGGKAGPLFILQGGAPLTRSSFVTRVQAALIAASLPGKEFNGHSFRIGAATTANQAGVPETTIKVLGRWNSLVYQQYIRPSQEQLAPVSQALANQSEPIPPRT